MGFSSYNPRAYCEGSIRTDKFREAPSLGFPPGSLWMNEDPEVFFVLLFRAWCLYGVNLYAIPSRDEQAETPCFHTPLGALSVSVCVAAVAIFLPCPRPDTVV